MNALSVCPEDSNAPTMISLNPCQVIALDITNPSFPSFFIFASEHFSFILMIWTCLQGSSWNTELDKMRDDGCCNEAPLRLPFQRLPVNVVINVNSIVMGGGRMLLMI
jgi:hypothetical protein